MVIITVASELETSIRDGILFTGIGMLESVVTLSEFCKKNRVRRVINIGTCVSRKIGEIGKIIQVGQIYGPPDASFKQGVFELGGEVELESHYKFVEKISDMVKPYADMEAYGQAMFCAKWNIQFKSIKVVSDWAGETSKGHWKDQVTSSGVRDIVDTLIKSYNGEV